MASYRYARDIDPKDLTPRKKRAYTRKERWANSVSYTHLDVYKRQPMVWVNRPRLKMQHTDRYRMPWRAMASSLVWA